MSSFKEKSQGFIIGIMVGLIVAGGFFILKLDDYFKELNFYKSVSNTFSINNKEAEPIEVDSTKELSSFSLSLSKCDKKICFYYTIIVFVLLLICKPKFILEKKTLNDDSKNISISKLILWQLVFCVPLIFYYIINY